MELEIVFTSCGNITRKKEGSRRWSCLLERLPFQSAPSIPLRRRRPPGGGGGVISSCSFQESFSIVVRESAPKNFPQE